MSDPIGPPPNDARQSNLVSWYRELRGDLTWYGTQLIGDRDIAEDLVHTIFLRLVARKRRGEVPPLGDTYFRVALRNEARKLMDRARVRKDGRSTVRAELYARSVPTPEEKVEESMLRELLDGALAELTPRAREVFELAVRRGLHATEVAEQMGITTATVYSQVAVARDQMRKLLKVPVAGNDGIR